MGGTVSPGNEESAHRPVGAGWWRVALILLLVGLLVRSVLASGGEGFTTGSVQALYLSSYDQRMTWCREILRGIEETLQPDSNHIVLDVFNMDSKRYREPAYFDRIRDLLAEKYRGARFSLLLCSDNNAFDFLRRYRDSLFPGVPVVFCGINDYQDEQIRDLKGFTGVAQVFSIRETVETILRLHPDTREIFMVNDFQESGRLNQRDMRRELADLQDRVQLTDNEDLPVAKLHEQLAALRVGTVVLLGVYYVDRSGRYFTEDEVRRQLAAGCQVPVYTLHEFYVGEGVLGGEVLSGFAQGEAMARMAQRILKGEDPDSIPVLKTGVNRPVFDYPQMARFHIAPKQLPADSVIVNKPFSLYEMYTTEIWALAGLFVALLLLVALLVVYIRLRARAELELRANEKRFRQLADASLEGILIHDGEKVLLFNDLFLSMFGYTASEIIGQNVVDLIIAPSGRKGVQKRIEESLETPYRTQGLRKDGTEFPLEVRLRFLDYEGRRVRVAVLRDLTQQNQIEERLIQSQKIEAIGTLAGGIAHDFNNILSAILGYAELARQEVPEGSEIEGDLEQILQAGTRAKDLVRQILAFSRQTKSETAPVNLAALVKETMKMLRATLPSTIEIQTAIESDSYVLADPSQIHQVITNLATNASLAMRESGGRLDLTLRDIELTRDESLSYPGLDAGKYIRLSVSDTGCGMTPEVRSRIFEPFYTTRPRGEGTGLGLSTALAIVQRFGGIITVYSEPNVGSTFQVLLPRMLREIERVEEQEKKPLPRGMERILVVDDEAFQVDLATKILGGLGYHVTAVDSSEQALELYRKNPRAFDLVITDMTMPGMTGDVLIARLRGIRPDVAVMLCSGYSERLSRDKIKALGVRAFAMKPLLVRELAEKVRETLDNL
ncbi:MAG TPA: ABC transporter substrate binding protein [Candidatus Sumerlaeota bacterium]|nr:ABC transporter substrate binding protein [Candidatus Sumerlaeota bacterium]